MGFVRCRQYDAIYEDGYWDMPSIAVLSHFSEDHILVNVDMCYDIHHKMYKKHMALRERIQRRFPPKIGRFLL